MAENQEKTRNHKKTMQKWENQEARTGKSYENHEKTIGKP